MEDTNTYRVPETFHPFTCMDAIRGLADAIHLYMHQGPGSRNRPGRANQGGLVALIDLLQQHVHQLHDWLLEIENLVSFDLPVTRADFEALHASHDGKDEARDEKTHYG